MKIDSSLSAVVNPRQSKSAKEPRASVSGKPADGFKDDVNVAAQAYSSQAAPAASFGEALDLTRNIDFRKAIDASIIPGDTAFQLAGLIQA